MSDESDDSGLRELARQEPEAFKSVAEKADGELRGWLESILEDERGGPRE